MSYGIFTNAAKTDSGSYEKGTIRSKRVAVEQEKKNHNQDEFFGDTHPNNNSSGFIGYTNMESPHSWQCDHDQRGIWKEFGFFLLEAYYAASEEPSHQSQGGHEQGGTDGSDVRTLD